MVFSRQDRMRFATAAIVLAALVTLFAVSASGADETTGAITVLTNDSYLRSFIVFKTPVVMTKDGKVETALEPVAPRNQAPKPLAEFQSPLPPADWTKADFDDSSWERRRAPVEVRPGVATGSSHAARFSAAVSSLICLRGRFVVADPAAVKDLKLSLRYVGGIVVYVNGQEVGRGSLPAGALTADTLAEKYPADLYCEGEMFLQDPSKNPAAFARRYRTLEVAIPAAVLRKGTNSLALEIHRSPINEAATLAKRTPWAGMSEIAGIWAYAGLRDLSLTAAAGVEPNHARPKGVEVWNCAPFDTLTVHDWGDGGAPLPVTIAAARNGVFSGRLAVSSDQPIRGLKVTVTDLVEPSAGAGAKIPSSAVRVRCAAAAQPGKSWLPTTRFDALLDEIPAEIPVVKANPPNEQFLRVCAFPGEPIDRRGVTSGAIAPLWFTVRVPKDTKPGTYAGTITISADGLKPTSVPFRVVVSPWTLPDPKDFRIINFAYLSEDAIAKHYEVPMWSERHFALMGKSMSLMAEVNSRQAIINLAINFYGGNKGGVDSSNDETMVRWIKQGDGSFRYDFSIVDKYLDTVAKSMGKPSLLRVNCWGELTKEGKNAQAGFVSLLDPATGKLDHLEQPVFGTDESFAFWKPVLDELRKRIEARGWFDVTAMGANSYCYGVNPKIVSVYKRIWPDGVWSYTAHNGVLNSSFAAAEPGVKMPIRHADAVWTLGPLKPRGYRALFLPRTTYWCFTFRSTFRDYSPLTLARQVPEEEIMRGHDGLSDFGADLFPVKSARGYYCIANGRGTGGPSCGTQALLAPGPDGAMATERFEMFREGVELGEAILFLQKALDDKKVSGDLAQRIDRYLEERGTAYINGWWAGRYARDMQLIALAGEAAAQSR